MCASSPALPPELPADAATLPPFNPFKLYSDETPVSAANGDPANAAEVIAVNVVDVRRATSSQMTASSSGRTTSKSWSPKPPRISPTPATPLPTQGEGEATLQQASYRPDQVMGQTVLAPNMTVIQKTGDDTADDDSDDDTADALPDGSETKTLIVGRGDTMSSLFSKIGTEPTEAKTSSMPSPPSSGARSQARPGAPLHAGARAVRHRRDGAGQGQRVRQGRCPPRHRRAQQVWRLCRFRPIHRRTSRRDPASSKARSTPRSTPASITRRLSQHLAPDTILKLLRVHSYDVDFKQKVKPGDNFEIFFECRRRGRSRRRRRSCSTPR